MARKGENIYKRKDGRWEGRYIKSYGANGHAMYCSVYAKTYAEVKQKLHDSSVNSYQQKKQNYTLLLNQVANEWLSVGICALKESTQNKYRNLYWGHIEPSLGKYPIEAISNQLVQQFVSDKLLSGRKDGKGGLSDKTVQDILAVLKLIFAYSEVCGAHISCSLRSVRIKKHRNLATALTPGEQSLLESYLWRETNLYKAGTLLCLYTGIRIGELCALRWKDISLDLGELRVSKTMQRIQMPAGSNPKTQVVISEPKSECSNRTIPLPPFIIEMLSPLQESESSFLLSGSGCFIEPRTLQYRFKAFTKQAGIADISFHSLRHTFATRCVELGFDIKSLSEILGHSSVNITLNRYVHSSQSLKKSCMDKLAPML